MRASRKANLVAASILFVTPACSRFIPIEPMMRAPLDLLSRASGTCPTDNTLDQCGQGFPSTFCCQIGSKCVSIDNGNGVLCCPAGSTCSNIDAVAGACQADAYNVTATPNSPVHLINIPSTFTQCNGSSNCCPPGFQCNNNICLLQNSADTSAVSGSPTAAASSAVLLPSAHSSPTSTANPSSAQATNPDQNTVSQSTSDFPPTAVLAGFFPGLAAGSLLAMLVIMWMGKRRKQRVAAAASFGKHSDSTSSLGPVRAQVSDPIYHDDGAGRVDFLRRGSRPNHTPIQRHSPGLGRIRSLFSASTPGQSPRGLGVGVDSSQSPHTPQRELRKEPSTESITIFSPPEMRVDSEAGDRYTKFSDLMPGLKQNEPMPGGYVGSPGMVDPRSRGVDNGRLR